MVEQLASINGDFLITSRNSSAYVLCSGACGYKSDIKDLRIQLSNYLLYILDALHGGNSAGNANLLAA
jgi:hypothetical protein